MSETTFSLSRKLAAMRQELRETRARLAFTEKLEHQQFLEKRTAQRELAVALSEIKEKRAAVLELAGVLSEVKELLAEAEAEGDER